MSENRRYEVEGMTVDIPIHYDEQSEMFLEDYPDFIENPIWTPKEHRVLFAGTDACAVAVESGPGGCPDCGSCKYFRLAAEHTWFGVCSNQFSPKNSQNIKEEIT